MTTKTAIAAATLAASFATALTLVSLPASAEDSAGMDKCYGVSLKGKNDCKAGAGTSCAGTSKIDYQRDAWKYVPKGTCETIKTPKGTGSMSPT
jgi:uncharacterized membrane protein